MSGSTQRFDSAKAYSAVTRAGLLADGRLVSISDVAEFLGLPMDIAMTRGAYEACVRSDAGGSLGLPDTAAFQQTCFLFLMLYFNLVMDPDACINLAFDVVSPAREGKSPKRVQLRHLQHLGDHLEQVVTIALAEEVAC